MKAVAILLVCLASVAFAGIPWQPEPRTDDYFRNKHNEFVANTLNNGHSVRVLFYGDSITDWWATEGKPVFDQYYAPLGTANYGIAADRTEHVLWRIINGEITDHINPAVCVIKIGTNNIFDNSPYDISQGIQAIVLELRARLPNMKILLLGVLPRNNAEITDRTAQVNSIIRQMDNGSSIRYLDLSPHFYRGNGQFNTELYSGDLLHLSQAGYRKWAEVMDNLFREMLGTTSKLIV